MAESERERLLAAIAEDDESYGFGLMGIAHIHSSKLYPLLDELVAEGLVEKYLEPEPEDRPARTLYRVRRASQPLEG